jgi:hypothetical protein
VRRELEIQGLLRRCHAIDCTFCILSATSADLDAIVESEIKSGSISISEDAA